MKKYRVEKYSKALEQGVADEQFIFRAMSYNIHGGINANREVGLQRTLNIIDESDADIVALQEVDTEKTAVKNRNQARSLAESLNMDYIFFRLKAMVCMHSDLPS